MPRSSIIFPMKPVSAWALSPVLACQAWAAKVVLPRSEVLEILAAFAAVGSNVVPGLGTWICWLRAWDKRLATLESRVTSTLSPDSFDLSSKSRLTVFFWRFQGRLHSLSRSLVFFPIPVSSNKRSDKLPTVSTFTLDLLSTCLVTKTGNYAPASFRSISHICLYSRTHEMTIAC